MDDPQGLQQSIVHADGGGMMVRHLVPPILAESIHIQIKALDLLGPVLNSLHRFRGKSDRRQTGGTAQTFLGSAVTDIDPPFVHFHRVTAQRGNRIDEEEGLREFFHHGGKFFQGLKDPGGGFGMDQRQDLGTECPELLLHVRGLKRLAPGSGKFLDLGPAAPGNLHHALAEKSVHADQDLVARARRR